MSAGQSITAQLELHSIDWRPHGEPRPISREPMTWELADVAPGLYAWRVVFRWGDRMLGYVGGPDHWVRERDTLQVGPLDASDLSTLGA